MNITHTHIQAYTHICIVLVSGVGDMITHFSVDTKLPSYFLIYLNNEGWVFNAVQFNHSVVTDSLQPHEQQHARPPVQHQLPEFTQTQVHWVGDAIQPSHLLLSPSPPALNLSQHQGLFQWVSSLHHIATVLALQFQHQYFKWIVTVDFL